eukprot:tig00021133_g18908.t1
MGGFFTVPVAAGNPAGDPVDLDYKHHMPIPPMPANFDPSDPHKDPVVYLRQKEHVFWEKWALVGEMRLVREELTRCHRREGVNALHNCRELAKKYLEMCKTTGFAVQQNPNF